MSGGIFVWLLAIVLLANASILEAQQAKKVPRIGLLIPASASATAHMVEAFRQGLREHGYVDKQNLTLEPRFGEGKAERLAGLAAELVRSKVDVIVAGSTPGIIAARTPLVRSRSLW